MSLISVASKPHVLVVRMRQLTTMVGLSRSSIYVFVSKGLFPQPIRLGPKAVGWRVNEVEEWLESRPHSIDLDGRGK
jgi:prophage regulatory protein